MNTTVWEHTYLDVGSVTNDSPFCKHRYGKLNTLLNWVFLLIVAIFWLNDHLRGYDKSESSFSGTAVIKEGLLFASVFEWCYLNFHDVCMNISCGYLADFFVFSWVWSSVFICG